MKRMLCCILVLFLMLSLTACGARSDIVGVWEQEMETTILGEGIEESVSVGSLQRFTFREDGSGLQEHIMMDGSYPDAVREFHYHVKEDTLTLVYAEEHMEEFFVKVNKNSLKLENSRGSYDLTRAE